MVDEFTRQCLTLEVEHRMIHGGAPVASQQSRILRVDRCSVSGTASAGDVPRPKTINNDLTS